jgi:hypothetical protein
MQGYLVDPEAMTITVVEVDTSKGITAICDLIEASPFAVVTFSDNGDGVYVDDESLLHVPTHERNYFYVEGHDEPLIGKGLVLGVDDEGESTTPKTAFTVFRQNVHFLDRNMVHQLARAGNPNWRLAARLRDR